MTLAFLATLIAAETPKMRVCFANEADEAVSVFGEHWKPGETRFTMFVPPDIAPGSEYCWSTPIDSDKPLKFTVHRVSDRPPHSEWPEHPARCPNVIPGLDVKLVVGLSGKDLTCTIRGRG